MRRFVGTLTCSIILTLAAAGCGGTDSGAQGGGSTTVTIYTADGLKDWYGKQFAAFTGKTGIEVQTVEAGSGEVVSRLQKEKTNTQADVVVTLPPYIQRAAQEGLLQAYRPAGADQVTGASSAYTPLVNNYLCFIYNPDKAVPPPKTWNDLLTPQYSKKLQYSTPGQAGDGTAVLIQLQHVLGKQGALDYLKKLEANNVGQSSSTGKLQPKVSKGEIFVANGDVQMNLASINNDKSNFKIFFPADSSGKRSTFSIPYTVGLAANAPHADAGRKLIEFLLSPEAQQAVTDQAYGIPARGDVKPSDAKYKAIEESMAGVEIWSADWEQILADLDADLAAYKKTLGLA
jgi:2-aminoethylphosphonate transport system substrate-binding protein